LQQKIHIVDRRNSYWDIAIS